MSESIKSVDQGVSLTINPRPKLGRPVVCWNQLIPAFKRQLIVKFFHKFVNQLLSTDIIKNSILKPIIKMHFIKNKDNILKTHHFVTILHFITMLLKLFTSTTFI